MRTEGYGTGQASWQATRGGPVTTENRILPARDEGRKTGHQGFVDYGIAT